MAKNPSELNSKPEERPAAPPQGGTGGKKRAIVVGSFVLMAGAAAVSLFFFRSRPASPVYARVPVAAAGTTTATGALIFPKGPATTGPHAGYIGSASCSECHADITESFKTVAMSRSFTRPTPETTPESFTSATEFHHADSHQYFRMLNEGGKLYQVSYQKDFDGRPTNELKAEVHYVLGSGAQARSFLHHADDGKLYQLPMGWYSEEQSWGMNPGYDRKNHAGFTKRITYDCAFCHAATPNLKPGMDRYNVVDTVIFPKEHELQAIDCERCHGPAAKHVELARQGAPRVVSRKAIVNPALLSTDLQLDVCYQCHLDSTSMKLPRMVYVPGESVYSFRPGESITSYSIHVDHAPGTGHDDKHEIAGHGYRFRMAECFKESEGQMTCTTCHNPHHTPKKADLLSFQINNCLKCHDAGGGLFPNLADDERLRHDGPCVEKLDLRLAERDNCITCHMPQRRTDDVVHVVMTDHSIPRRKPDRDLLAPLKENHHDYKGEIVLYEPKSLPPDETNYYLGYAHLADAADPEKGLAMLSEYLKKYPDHVDGLTMRGMGLRNLGRTDEAIRDLSRVLELRSDFIPAYVGLAEAYEQKQDYARAAELFERALKLRPDVSLLHNGLGVNRYLLGDLDGALASYQAAAHADKNDANPRFNLAGLYRLRGQLREAIAANREGIAISPNNFDGAKAMAELLAETGEWREAAWYATELVTLYPDRPDALDTLAGVVLRAPADRREGLLRDVAGSAPAEARLLAAAGAEQSGNKAEALAALSAVSSSATSSTAALHKAATMARRLGSFTDAEASLRQLLRLSPGSEAGTLELARLLAHQEREAESEQLLLESMAPPRLPNPAFLNAFAWLKATAKSDSVRDGAEAEECARYALEIASSQNPFFLDTLAAALAEQSKFDEAQKTVQAAIAQAKKEGLDAPARAFEANLELYRAGKPVRGR